MSIAHAHPSPGEQLKPADTPRARFQRPSFVSGLGSLLDLSGQAMAKQNAIRPAPIRTPERAIADAWLFVGHSFHAVLPPDRRPVGDDENGARSVE